MNLVMAAPLTVVICVFTEGGSLAAIRRPVASVAGGVVGDALPVAYNASDAVSRGKDEKGAMARGEFCPLAQHFNLGDRGREEMSDRMLPLCCEGAT